MHALENLKLTGILVLSKLGIGPSDRQLIEARQRNEEFYKKCLNDPDWVKAQFEGQPSGDEIVAQYRKTIREVYGIPEDADLSDPKILQRYSEVVNQPTRLGRILGSLPNLRKKER